MKWKILPALLLLLPAVFALDCSSINPTQIRMVSMDYEASGDVHFVFENSNAVVEDFVAYIRIVPQMVHSADDYTGFLGTDEFNNNILVFSQDSVTTNTLSWYFRADISSQTSIVKIPENPEFPYPTNEFPASVQEYIDFTAVTDTSPEIQLKVNELISGVTDYFTAIATLTKFVSFYLEYNPLYAPLSTPASEVYEQQGGVCDEFSSLLISMMRNAGIPARFVSGFAYTNTGERTCTNFGPHSWVEVYVPDYGWIQIDPTYKEFFGVDAGHVPLYESNDAGTNIINASIVYLYSSFSIDSPAFDIELMDYSFAEQQLNFDIDMLPYDEVGEGDYVLFNVSIENPYNEWVLDSLYLTKTADMELVYNNNSIPVILPPNSVSNYYFMFLTPSNIDCPLSSCIFSYPFVFTLASGGYEEFNLTINPDINVPDYSQSYLQQISGGAKQYYKNLVISSKSITPAVVVDTEPFLSFDVQNTGNMKIENLTVSINYDNIHYSENIGDLFISQTYLFNKSLSLPSTTGVVNVNSTVSADNVSVSFIKSFTIVGAAPFNFRVSGISEYTTAGDYVLNLAFSSIPSDFINADIRILINGQEIVNQPYYFSKSEFELAKDYFSYGNNTVTAIIQYNTASGDSYMAQDSLIVNSRIDLTIWQQIVQFFNAIIDLFKLLLDYCRNL